VRIIKVRVNAGCSPWCRSGRSGINEGVVCADIYNIQTSDESDDIYGQIQGVCQPVTSGKPIQCAGIRYWAGLYDATPEAPYTTQRFACGSFASESAPCPRIGRFENSVHIHYVGPAVCPLYDAWAAATRIAITLPGSSAVVGGINVASLHRTFGVACE